MIFEDDVLLEKVMNSIMRANPSLEIRPFPKTAYGRRRMLATLLFVWVGAGNRKKTMLMKASGLNNEDRTLVDVALEKAVASERKRREDTGTPRFSMNKFRSDFIERQVRGMD